MLNRAPLKVKSFRLTQAPHQKRYATFSDGENVETTLLPSRSECLSPLLISPSNQPLSLLNIAQGNAIKLFKFSPSRRGDRWELYSANVTPNFYDANEDKASAKPQWFLEAGDLEVEVTDKFSFEQSSKRATFVGTSGIWALRFPTTQAFQGFVNEYNGKLFENIYNVKNDEENREKVRHSTHLTPPSAKDLQPFVP